MAYKIRHNATATYRPKCFVRFFFLLVCEKKFHSDDVDLQRSVLCL